MQLAFPNARLYIHSLLSAEGLSGPEAIVEGARHYGIIGAANSKECLSASNAMPCQCMDTGKRIMQKHFDIRYGSISESVTAGVIWASVEKECNKYIEQIQYTIEKLHSCRKFAPVLFDVLLQHVHRYG